MHQTTCTLRCFVRFHRIHLLPTAQSNESVINSHTWNYPKTFSHPHVEYMYLWGWALRVKATKHYVLLITAIKSYHHSNLLPTSIPSDGSWLVMNIVKYNWTVVTCSLGAGAVAIKQASISNFSPHPTITFTTTTSTHCPSRPPGPGVEASTRPRPPSSAE